MIFLFTQVSEVREVESKKFKTISAVWGCISKDRETTLSDLCCVAPLRGIGGGKGILSYPVTSVTPVTRYVSV